MEKVSRPRTDLTRWRLTTSGGAHRWSYLAEEDAKKQPLSFAEKYFLGLPQETPKISEPQSLGDSAAKGLQFYQKLQLDDGHWACGYGGLSFLIPCLVFAMYITETPIPSEWKTELIAWIADKANEDGGWGLHLLGETAVFSTALYYVTFRVLGLDVSDPLVVRTRTRLLALGGAIGVPTLGKIFLCLLNLYDWEGVNPIPPELWLLPDWVPIHPWRWWIHTRAGCLPMSYLYVNKCQMPLNTLLKEIREEIYIQPYSSIRFRQHCYTVAASDMRLSPSIMRTMNPILRFWDTYLRPTWLLRKTNYLLRDLMRREDENTSYNNASVLIQAFQMAAVYFADGEDSFSVSKHRESLYVFTWQGSKGMEVGGTDGVQVWDTSLSVLAVVEAGLATQCSFRAVMIKALEYLEMSQLRHNVCDPYRQQRKGGWTFSTKTNGLIVTDCSAETLKAVILLQEDCDYPKLISDARLFDCIDSLLIMQSSNGGFASYESTRASVWLEKINTQETLDQAMVEHNYPECTSSVLTAFALFRQHFPYYRAAEIETSISRATSYILANQQPNGSWYGSWAICYTYATYFALEGLEATHQTYQTSEHVRKACDWLVSVQKSDEDGGWGEHWSSCEQSRYVQHEKSQIINTCWAVLALMTARYPHKAVIERGLQFIQSQQQPSGEWLQEDLVGMTNRTCVIPYPNYKFHFPIRALGKYEHVYLPWLKEYIGSRPNISDKLI